MSSSNIQFSGRKDYDAEFCGSIPLNYINLIQAHGVLLVLQRNAYTIVQASENTEQLLGIAARELVQQPLQAFVGETQLSLLTSRLDQRKGPQYLPLSLQWESSAGPKSFSATLYSRDSYLLLELEPQRTENTEQAYASAYQNISTAISLLKDSRSLEEVSLVAVQELRRISGFDRVMVYKFDENWNGKVVAEALSEEIKTSYLGLHFPASDIPKQARELYFKTPYRLIADIHTAPSRLYPIINPLTSSISDISDCLLRGVPLVHAEYLQNMGVVASMSTPIIVDNQLWGLISCHHSSAKVLSFALRTSFEILSGVIASQLGAREKEESFRYRAQLHGVELKLLEQVYTRNSLSEGLLEKPSYLLDLLEVEGVVLAVGQEYKAVGDVPPESWVKGLIKWLSRYSREKIFTTDSLPTIYQEATAQRELASGLIALQITGGRHYLLGFRPEVIKLVDWGGNPNEAIQLEADGKQYHPRNSFKLWREQVEYTALPWQSEVLEVAQHLRTAMLERLLKEE